MMRDRVRALLADVAAGRRTVDEALAHLDAAPIRLVPVRFFQLPSLKVQRVGLHVVRGHLGQIVALGAEQGDPHLIDDLGRNDFSLLKSVGLFYMLPMVVFYLLTQDKLMNVFGGAAKG